MLNKVLIIGVLAIAMVPSLGSRLLADEATVAHFLQTYDKFLSKLGSEYSCRVEGQSRGASTSYTCATWGGAQGWYTCFTVGANRLNCRFQNPKYLAWVELPLDQPTDTRRWSIKSIEKQPKDYEYRSPPMAGILMGSMVLLRERFRTTEEVSRTEEAGETRWKIRYVALDGKEKGTYHVTFTREGLLKEWSLDVYGGISTQKITAWKSIEGKLYPELISNRLVPTDESAASDFAPDYSDCKVVPGVGLLESRLVPFLPGDKIPTDQSKRVYLTFYGMPEPDFEEPKNWSWPMLAIGSLCAIVGVTILYFRRRSAEA